MEYIANAFSLQMVRPHHLPFVRFTPLGTTLNIEAAVSIVGHADTARALGVECHRQSVTLNPGDVLYVAQLTGGRLPEGCATLPEGAAFQWVKVHLDPACVPEPVNTEPEPACVPEPEPVNTNPIPLGPETPQKICYVPGLRAGFTSSREDLVAMDAPDWLPLGSMACGIQAGTRDEPSYVRRAFCSRPGAFVR